MRQALTTDYSATNTAGTYTSSPQELTHMLGYCFQARFVGAGTGTITLELSNDQVGWDLISGSSVALSSPSTLVYNVTDAFYKFVRMKIVVSTGTITSNVTCQAKGA